MSFDRLRKPQQRFTQVPNGLICSPELTAKAKAVYCYLISRPDDWKFYTSEIATNMYESEKTVKKAIKELISFGWIDKQQIRVKGKYSHNVYSIYYEVSTVNPKTVGGKTDDHKTDDHFLPPTNTNNTNTEIIKTEKSKGSLQKDSFFKKKINLIKSFIDMKNFLLDNRLMPNGKQLQLKYAEDYVSVTGKNIPYFRLSQNNLTFEESDTFYKSCYANKEQVVIYVLSQMTMNKEQITINEQGL